MSVYGMETRTERDKSGEEDGLAVLWDGHRCDVGAETCEAYTGGGSRGLTGPMPAKFPVL